MRPGPATNAEPQNTCLGESGPCVGRLPIYLQGGFLLLQDLQRSRVIFIARRPEFSLKISFAPGIVIFQIRISFLSCLQLLA